MPAGRKPTLEINPDVQTKIMRFVRLGAYPERAAVAAGIGERTHYLWQAKGLEEREHREAGKTPRKTWQVYLDYVAALEQAIAEAEMLMLGKVAKGGADADDNRWMLERRFRDRWSNKTPAAAAQAPVVASPSSATTLDQLAARREQRRGKKA